MNPSGNASFAKTTLVGWMSDLTYRGRKIVLRCQLPFCHAREMDAADLRAQAPRCHSRECALILVGRLADSHSIDWLLSLLSYNWRPRIARTRRPHGSATASSTYDRHGTTTTCNSEYRCSRARQDKRPFKTYVNKTVKGTPLPIYYKCVICEFQYVIGLAVHLLHIVAYSCGSSDIIYIVKNNLFPFRDLNSHDNKRTFKIKTTEVYKVQSYVMSRTASRFEKIDTIRNNYVLFHFTDLWLTDNILCHIIN
jgi:hypothetical protein